MDGDVFLPMACTAPLLMPTLLHLSPKPVSGILWESTRQPEILPVRNPQSDTSSETNPTPSSATKLGAPTAHCHASLRLGSREF